ncbi:MAG: hypothetical protein J2P28_17525 [Actinobacteria bacterium]|nr:hypothetical protein [Actinomycetota bacterium]MBO0837289.1 hypothetical protein [Actinomycetota bacterium]
MNPGGEPERDDTGLPPVDIEIPDDARDLDRDVQAYHRELRAVRRHDRRTRWHPSLSRDGLVLPLLACCLILALITGTLLTVFTATSGQGLYPRGGATAGHPSAPGRSASGQPDITSTSGAPLGVTGRLPLATLEVRGTPPVAVRSLRRAMLLLVPADCACASTLNRLAGAARQANATAYLVYTPATQLAIEQLYSRLDSQAQAALMLAQDQANVLTSSANLPVGILSTRLTAILISPARTAAYVSDPTADEQTSLIRAMTG